MDFEVTYTPEQESFRADVRAWLADNIPDGLAQPIDPGDLSLEQYQKLRELGRRLGARGWLYPTYPKAYGGGDLPVDFVMILEEELDRYRVAGVVFDRHGEHQKRLRKQLKARGFKWARRRDDWIYYTRTPPSG